MAARVLAPDPDQSNPPMAPPPPPYATNWEQQQQPEAEAKSLWIGSLLEWMDEPYLYSCFTRSPELLSVVIKRNKDTGQPQGFGFLNFSDHAAAHQILHSYNGQKMPNAHTHFNLNWVITTPPHKHSHHHDSDHAIYVGGLAFDVTDFMLHHVFKTRYPSVKSAKVIWDKLAARSKGYGFVLFGDANEHRQAITEMNGAYCSSRPMRIGPAPNKRAFYTQGTDSDCNPNHSRLFVGDLDPSVTAEDLKKAFSPYGELVEARVIVGKNCGFVKYSSRASTEEAMRILNGSQLADKTIRVCWGRPLPNKQDHPQRSGPLYGWLPQDRNMQGYTGHPGYACYEQEQPQQPTVQ